MKHRKLISLFTAALLGISAAAFPPFDAAPSALVAEAASAETFISGNYKYSYVPGENTATFVRYTGSGTTPKPVSYIQTPDGKKKVTKIGSYAFHTASGPQWVAKPITSVTIPSTVTEICDNAFKKCTSLKTVSFPSKLKKIGNFAFEETKLTEVVLPETVTKIGYDAFDSCKSLKTVTIQSNANIGDYAFTNCTSLSTVNVLTNCTFNNAVFYNCTALKNLTLPSGCVYGAGVFSGCTALKKVNGITPWTLVNGVPLITSNAVVKELLGSAFSKCEGVGFVDKLCTAICDYVVKIETTKNSSEDWMGDAVKARQLHDWLVRHCMYEDKNNGETTEDPENHTYSGVFLSYKLNVRGTGIGETVCEGYAKAYAMLLRAAGIESYLVDANAAKGGDPGHTWNIVKISNRYYQCDTCWDASYYWSWISTSGTLEPYGTVYKHFMKSNSEMMNLHDSAFRAPYIKNDRNNAHPYLNYTAAAAQNALSKSNYTFIDTNTDGILDSDWDFNGTYNSVDEAMFDSIYHWLHSAVSQKYMKEFLYNLISWDMSPAYFRSIHS